MKRGPGPKRKTPLKRGDKPLSANPETTKAFVDRGRETARERYAEMQRARAQGFHPKAKKAAAVLTMAEALRTPFIARRPAYRERCARCRRRAETWHHWVAQQHLRTFARAQRLTPQTTRALLRKLLRDERNLTPFCWDCHDAGEHDDSPRGDRRFYGEEVPHSAFVFALELGPEYVARLRRRYPSRHAP